MESVFDWKYYLSQNEDLKDLFKNEFDAWNHFIKYGIYEGRLYKKYDEIFNAYFYINYYDDLIDSKINTRKLGIEHWDSLGLFEMRIGKQINYNNITLYDFTLNHIYEYFSISNIIDYIIKYSYVNSGDHKVKHITDNFYYVLSKKNHIDIDLKFYGNVNNLENVIYSKNNLLEHLYNYGLDGLIYHPKQLINIFGNIIFYEYNKKILLSYNNCKITSVKDFLQNNLYNKSFDELSNIIIKKIDSNLIDKYERILILIFIGNLERGNNIIDMLLKYKNIEQFDLAFCFNGTDIYNQIKDRINNDFINDKYSIYISKECGNDIVPTLLMYNDIIKTTSYKHIIKLQTKTCYKLLFELTDFLLNKPLEDLLLHKKEFCNSIGTDIYYEGVRNDFFNQILYSKYNDYIDIDKKFVGGTIFYSDSIYINTVLDFIQNNNYRAFLFNNMYDSNRIVIQKSYVHFLERLFGIIK